jgi:hypothetical protein
LLLRLWWLSFHTSLSNIPPVGREALILGGAAKTIVTLLLKLFSKQTREDETCTSVSIRNVKKLAEYYFISEFWMTVAFTLKNGTLVSKRVILLVFGFSYCRVWSHGFVSTCSAAIKSLSVYVSQALEGFFL